MKILVVGCGSIGERHTRNLLSLGSEAAVVEPREARREEITQKYGIHCYETTLAAYKADKFQAVLVTNPPNLHMETALEAAKQGCDLFIEKPFSHTLRGIDRLVVLSQKKKLITLVGCNLRFLKSLNKVREIVMSGQLGTIASARMYFGLYLPSWRPHQKYQENYGAHKEMGGGALLDVIHEFDYAYWLLGDAAQIFCYADKRSHLEIDTEDTAAALIKFRSGVIGEIHVDYVQRSYSRGCEIIGDQGTLQWKFSDQTISLLTADNKEWQQISFPQEVNEMYLDEIKHFLECIETRKPTISPFEEARRVLEITLAAKRSAEVGKRILLAA